MPESLMEEPEELRAWVRRAFEYAATLPKKVKKAAKPRARKPAARRNAR